MARLAAAQGGRLLLVDAAGPAAMALARRLAAAGYRVDRAYSWREGLVRAVSDDYHLILLDRDLPELDGLALVRILRSCGQAAPMLLLSGTDSPDARREALGAGADDLFVGPITACGLLARIADLARPPPEREAPNRLAVADLEIDLKTRAVARAGRPIRLSAAEFDLLACLLRHHGRAVSRDSLLRLVRGGRCDPGAPLLETSIERLRAKVDRGFPVKLVHVVPGVGYCLLDED
ncbi:MAG: DNA-binding response regulator [Phenylobacterium sp.]|nr:DNA-binding response regulator [Phenylobacterium sp.]